MGLVNGQQVRWLRWNIPIPQWEIRFPHSLGLLYSAFTYYTGASQLWQYKLMDRTLRRLGMSPITKHLIDIKPDGTFRLDMRYFNYATGLTMTNSRFDRLFKVLPPTRIK